MLIAHNIAGTVKGRTFSEDLGAVTCFHGANGAGKSTRLLAVELGLRGPRSKDRRFGPGTVQVVLDCAAGQIRRDIQPKHALTLNGKAGKLAELQAEITAKVPLAPEVFDVAAFVGMSEEKKRQALLDLAAPIAASAYAHLYPQVPPVAGERAGDWLGRAIEAAKQERLALQATVRDSNRSATSIGNAVRGRFESLDAAKLELGSAQAKLETMRQRQALAQSATATSEQLAQAQATLADLQIAVISQLPVDEAPLQAAVTAATDKERSWRTAEGAYVSHVAAAQALEKRLAAAAKGNMGALGWLLALHAEVVAGDLEAIGTAASGLGNHLEAKGFEAIGNLRQEYAVVTEKMLFAKTDFEVAAQAKAEAPLQAANKALADAQAHNRQVNHARAQANNQAAQRVRLVQQIQDLQAKLDRTLEQLGPADTAPTASDLAALQASVQELQNDVTDMAQRQGVRQAELKMQQAALEATKRIDAVKAIEEQLQDARSEVLRKAMAPVSDAMGPFCELMGGAFEVGEESVLGVRRGNVWLPVECLSDSEQALFGAGLALALASAGGGRLVLLDRLDVCDAARTQAVLEVAVRLVQAGQLDQVLCTAHTLPVDVPGVKSVFVADPGKV